MEGEAQGSPLFQTKDVAPTFHSQLQKVVEKSKTARASMKKLKIAMVLGIDGCRIQLLKIEAFRRFSDSPDLLGQELFAHSNAFRRSIPDGENLGDYTET